MKVLLKDDVKNIGKMGQIVEVADGYARNYLVPKGLAIEANTKNIKSMEHQKRIIQDNAKKIKVSAQDLLNKISTITLVIKAKAGEEGKLFGSVTTMDIAELLQNEGIEIDKKKISLDEPIKRLGSYSVNVKIHPEISTQVNIQVVEE
ncbi:MAG: 50S ribosomal protein L9 [Nitrospirae bacterium CG_4_10_14_0_8_um_filter_41_23]|nr:50S ribosomal protein L9 [Nitrospirota bacterium]OIP61542.1 MAG: 50S ribosomal protein L9 [Nitrospirae bacterium CG2_30_41_42]PIQ94827.1 MAG: 50S ribosomal protein L9 [Nitrospirae bacterium CG11_big_fil_rev_8_21_14_0_20_41_14]PIV43305.1 MAG: 50S ribosomal protein L9 [Nitrospirae bacterium CG02_land_8_20_14_3_00_41_53]PIW87735.1 MAG: 50S ribosomal protein L9 [Nitrospirae bacterium CG_4_8_14_3_um_filter_41_47]PIY86597.1 MAG: 50S ribosomal protein L9 [Nitrospirae bacterium CG_4_10_14_0_8_um_fi